MFMCTHMYCVSMYIYMQEDMQIYMLWYACENKRGNLHNLVIDFCHVNSKDWMRPGNKFALWIMLSTPK